mgnify:CR=1 FL=1
MEHITLKQLRHLLELDENSSGLGDELQAFIRQITSGGVAGKMTDPGEAMAKRLWDRGFGLNPKVKAENFKAYLLGIPQIPTGLVGEDSELPLLSLCDPRPGLLRSCKLLGIQHEELDTERTPSRSSTGVSPSPPSPSGSVTTTVGRTATAGPTSPATSSPATSWSARQWKASSPTPTTPTS